MKKIFFTITLMAALLPIFGQQMLHLHNGSQVVFEKTVTELDSITFGPYSSAFSYGNDYMTFPYTEIDSITFSADTLMNSRIVYITYNGNSVSVINPFESDGVSISTDGAHVTVTSEANLTDIQYHLSGQTTDGSFYITPDKRFTIYMAGVSITNPDGPAIQTLADKKVTITLANGSVNTLADGSDHSKKAALQSKGQIIFNGTGQLSVTGAAKHGIQSDDYIQINSGDIRILSAASDGLHCDYFVMNDGQLTISNVGGDAIDGDAGFIQVSGGTINITLPSADTKGLKCDSTVTIDGGAITMTISGNQSKGVKSGMNTVINNGVLNFICSGSAVLESSGSGYDPSYCTAIKSDADLVINGGHTTINCTSTNAGGKGLSASGDIVINDGYVNITTAGNGATYTNESGVLDSYTCACIKGDADVHLLGGTITCSSTGSGGKGINVDSMLYIGNAGADNDMLTLTVSTSGERITVSGGTGGGGQPGQPGQPEEGDYANPKAIKSLCNMYVNSGNITITCTQNNEGGEGLESKDTLTINGGNISISTYDDCINAANHLRFNGGTIYCVSSGNDAIDGNGTISMTGGLIVANGTRQPEAGIDCDQYTFSITGGTAVATGGDASTNFSGGQKVVKYTGAGNRAIQILNSANEAVLTYQIPSSGGNNPGGGGPGGGGPGGNSSLTLIFTDPQLAPGTYTLKYGGTITGGSSFHGYYTGATYSGGSSKTFTISSSQMATVNAN